jgi:hypothetical protein
VVVPAAEQLTQQHLITVLTQCRQHLQEQKQCEQCNLDKVVYKDMLSYT